VPVLVGIGATARNRLALGAGHRQEISEKTKTGRAGHFLHLAAHVRDVARDISAFGATARDAGFFFRNACASRRVRPHLAVFGASRQKASSAPQSVVAAE
jgi:hypothetical protein